MRSTHATLASLDSQVRECRIRTDALDIKKRSAEEAVHVSSRSHNAYKSGLHTTPSSRPQRATATANMPPPPPRASANAVHHTRPARASPVERSDPSATWAAVASRRPRRDAHIATDDSYLDVRVSSLRHHTGTSRLPHGTPSSFCRPRPTRPWRTSAARGPPCDSLSILRSRHPFHFRLTSSATPSSCATKSGLCTAPNTPPRSFRTTIKRSAKVAFLTAESNSTRPPATAQSKRAVRATVTNPQAVEEKASAS